MNQNIEFLNFLQLTCIRLVMEQVKPVVAGVDISKRYSWQMGVIRPRKKPFTPRAAKKDRVGRTVRYGYPASCVWYRGKKYQRLSSKLCCEESG
jgi:hypothetical protein